MSVANTLIENSISSSISSLSATVVTNTTSITKLEPFIIVDTVADANVNSGAAHYAFVGKPQGGAVDGIYLFSISFELQT